MIRQTWIAFALLVVLAAGRPVGLAAGEPAAPAAKPDPAAFAHLIGSLPVLHEGRIKPIDSAARHFLLALGRSSLPGGVNASTWLVEGLTDLPAAKARPAVKLRNPEVADALRLERRNDLRYSLTEVIDGMRSQSTLIEALLAKRQRPTDPVEAQLVELVHNASAALNALDFVRGLAVVPGDTAHREQWRTLASFSESQVAPDAVQSQIIGAWINLIDAMRAGDRTAAADRAAVVRALVAPLTTPNRLAVEVSYNRFALFHWSIALYVLAALLAGLALWSPRAALRQTAFAVLVLGVVLNLAGVAARCYIMNRPPVATLYETILFVALVSALTGALVELVRRDGIAVFGGALLGLGGLLIANGYAADGDTMGMLIAVLNSNMWLTIHVITITAGYAFCLVASLAAHFALIQRALRPLDGEALARTDRLLNVLALIALLLTLAGTILGGIWADQSWGRFWGWDPKENGALLIVLWLVTLLHLKAAGQCGPRGVALGLALVSIVVAVAWFGVNLLGIGLHSYGFDTGTAAKLGAFALAELIAGLALWAWATGAARAVQNS